MANPPLAIVLAAGQGTRMATDLPKVLVQVCNRPIVEYVLDAVEAAGITRIIVVIGYRAELVRDALSPRAGLRYVEQAEQLGTGHAVQMCREHLQPHQGAVLVLAGDSPLTQPESLRALMDLYQRERVACVMGTLLKDDPRGLGRIVRDAEGNFRGIVEEKDATAAERAIREVNMSTYVFDCQPLLTALDRLRNDNRQGEFYITDCPGILKQDGLDVRALPVLKACEALSINTLDELAIVEAEMRKQQCAS